MKLNGWVGNFASEKYNAMKKAFPFHNNPALHSILCSDSGARYNLCSTA